MQKQGPMNYPANHISIKDQYTLITQSENTPNELLRIIEQSSSQCEKPKKLPKLVSTIGISS